MQQVDPSTTQEHEDHILDRHTQIGQTQVFWHKNCSFGAAVSKSREQPTLGTNSRDLVIPLGIMVILGYKYGFGLILGWRIQRWPQSLPPVGPLGHVGISHVKGSPPPKQVDMVVSQGHKGHILDPHTHISQTQDFWSNDCSFRAAVSKHLNLSCGNCTPYATGGSKHHTRT